MRTVVLALAFAVSALPQSKVDFEYVKAEWPKATTALASFTEIGSIREVRAEVAMPVSPSARERMEKARQAKDDFGMAELIHSGEVLKLHSGTEIRILDRDTQTVEKLGKLLISSIGIDGQRRRLCEGYRKDIERYTRGGYGTVYIPDLRDRVAADCREEDLNRYVSEFWKKFVDPMTPVERLRSVTRVEVRVLSGPHAGKSGWLGVADVDLKKPSTESH